MDSGTHAYWLGVPALTAFRKNKDELELTNTTGDVRIIYLIALQSFV